MIATDIISCTASVATTIVILITLTSLYRQKNRLDLKKFYIILTIFVYTQNFLYFHFNSLFFAIFFSIVISAFTTTVSLGLGNSVGDNSLF